MKREKIISVRVNKELYDRVLFIIEDNTWKYETSFSKRYYNRLTGRFASCPRFYRKLSIADILEVAMEDFIKDALKSNTNNSN